MARIVLQRNCDPKLFSIINEFFEEVRRLIKSSLDKGIELGLVRPCDTEIVARSVMGALKEIIVGLLEREGVDPGEVADEIVRFGMRGVLRR